MSITLLYRSINLALQIQPTSDLDDAARSRRILAASLAHAIDAYVQDAIGKRMDLLPIAITCPPPSGVPVPSAGFTALINQRPSPEEIGISGLDDEPTIRTD